MQTTQKLATVTTIVRALNDQQSSIVEFLMLDARRQRNVIARCKQTYSDLSVSMGGGRNPNLLSKQAAVAKLTHNSHITDWEQVVMYLSAEKSSGIANLCPWATPECVAGCLQTSGHLGMSHGQRAMAVRTQFLVNHPFEFLVVLIAETRTNAKRINRCGKRMAQRLNGTSDIPWEKIPWLLELLRSQGVDQHFDYTKGHRRQSTDRYYLAKSVTERTAPADVQPGMVAVVDVTRTGDLPTMWHGKPVIDGDHTNGDLRFLDRNQPEAVVLLRAKGSLRGVDGRDDGFVKAAVS